jgi:hypothetical protein
MQCIYLPLHFFTVAQPVSSRLRFPIFFVFFIPLRHTTLARTRLTRDRPAAETSTRQHTTLTTDRHPRPPDEIRTRNPNKRSAADPRFRPRGYRDRLTITYANQTVFIGHRVQEMQSVNA